MGSPSTTSGLTVSHDQISKSEHSLPVFSERRLDINPLQISLTMRYLISANTVFATFANCYAAYNNANDMLKAVRKTRPSYDTDFGIGRTATGRFSGRNGHQFRDRWQMINQTLHAVQKHSGRQLAALGVILSAAIAGCSSETPDNSSAELPISNAIDAADNFAEKSKQQGRISPIDPESIAQNTSPVGSNPPMPSDPTLSTGLSTPMITPGITEPPMFSVDDVNLPEEAMIIGFVLDGQPRAYLQEAMTPISAHIVNDIVGNKPVSVTFCDQTDCVRVFSSTTEGKPIDLKTGGFASEEMLIMLNGQMHPQTSTTIPLQDIDFVRTQWIAWKVEHPETKIFLGSLAEKYARKEKE